MTYQIRAISVDGNILKFTSVESYLIEEGLVRFIDSHTKTERSFPTSKVQIEEEVLKDE